MKNEKETFRLADILVRSFRKELTSEEQAVLDDWLAEDEHHRILYKQYAGEEFLKKKTNEAGEIDWQKDYQEFIRKYPVSQKMIHPGRWMKYAALFILPITLGLFLWMKFSDVSVENTAEVLSVVKGKPILTLAGGQKIVLTDSVRMQETDGTFVAVETGELSYQSESCGKPGNQQIPLYNYLEIPRGAEYFLKLADGTQIWLNSESTIRYPVSFSGHLREVYLDGEAFFKVSRDSLHPFVVHAADSRIEVLGTEFNVRNYKDEKMVATTLVCGSVRLSSEVKNAFTILKPGEQGVIDRTDGGLNVREVDTYLYTAWKDARFVFRSTRMEELLDTLARWYDLQIFYQNESVKNIRFTGDMPRMADFHQLLNIIENNDLVRFTVKERTVMVSLK